MGKRSKQARREAREARRLEKEMNQEERIALFRRMIPGISSEHRVSKNERMQSKLQERNSRLDIIGLDRSGEAKKQLIELSGRLRARNDIIVIPPFLTDDLSNLLDMSSTRVIILPTISTPAIVRSY